MPASVEVAAFRGTIPDAIPVRPPPLVPFPELPEASTRRHLDDGWRVGAADYCWWWRVAAVLDAVGKIGAVRDEGTVRVTLHHDVQLYLYF